MKVLKRNRIRALLQAPVLALIMAFAITGIALALTMSNGDGVWSNATGDNGEPYCIWYNNSMGDTTNNNYVRYGDPVDWPDCDDHTYQSGFGYNGAEGISVITDAPFLLGQLTHYNNPIRVYDNKTFKQVDIDLNLDFDSPDINSSLHFVLNLHETSNDGSCEYPGSTSCPDKVWFDNLVTSETFYNPDDGKYYTLQILGFQTRVGSSCGAYNPALSLFNEFITEEDQNNYACLYGKVVEAGITIVKDADPDHYRDFNFSMTSSDTDPLFDQSFVLDDDEGCAAEGPEYCDANGNLYSDTQSFSGLLPGTYTVVESFESTAAWLTSPPTCSINGQEVPTNDLDWTVGTGGKGGTLVLTLGEDDNIVCIFNNIANGGPSAVSIGSVTGSSTSQFASWLLVPLAAVVLLGGAAVLRRKPYETPQVTQDLELETRAGSGLGEPDLLDLPGE